MQVVIDIPDDLYNALMEVNDLVEMYGFAKFIANGTPLPKGHGDLIDRSVLKNKIAAWLPPDPCGCEEKEYPFETDIIVSTLMEIDESKVIIPADKDGELNGQTN